MSPDPGRLLIEKPTVTPLERYRAEFADVPGWFNSPAIALWDTLLSFQSQHATRGNFLEIGVWKGRSALLLALHSTDGEECVFIDPMPLDEARTKLMTIRQSGLHFIRRNSGDLVPSMLPGTTPPSYRWIHIDGEHSGFAVAHDLELASNLLGPGGIIAVDDFFSVAYPQITFAVVEYLRAHPKSLMMFLCGFQKCYLCRPSDGRRLLQYVAEQLGADLEKRGVPKVTLYKTTDPLDLNAFGIKQRTNEGGFRGPDWDPGLLLY